MKRIFVVGGAGKIARYLAPRLAKQGDQALSLYRHFDQEPALKALSAIPVYGDLQKLSPESLALLMDGCDAVVFTAGAGGKGGTATTTAVDGVGLEKSVEAAKLAGIKRFILVSAFPEAGRGRHISDTFEHYMQVKKAADVYLAATDLDWVIVRPGTLTDDAATARINTGLAIRYGHVSRDNVAATLAYIVAHDSINRVIIELTDGDTPIEQVLTPLARY
ncbi:NAD-dependent dehydratase [Shewanella mangrovi]|uniref:NAD-dependent dehydratase n=1 Tax=Shewanella mangrovi TaxID=1515746 RepID=A0A094JCZ1_9GAMM|nr:NAD(P)H-binding protein [Shewanella mangrovi]KFZ37785.1 NAD-dependent dehydratase [Shewanella mangrovi]